MNDYVAPPWETKIQPDKPTIKPKDLKGIWFPDIIFFHKDLTYQEKFLLTIIYHLDGPDHCYASNKYLAEMMLCSEKTIANILGSLKKKGFVETVSWDGKIRKLRHTLLTLY